MPEINGHLRCLRVAPCDLDRSSTDIETADLIGAAPHDLNGEIAGTRSDLEHAAFDNCAFWDEDHVVFVEDRGDGLHAQGNALDSGWLLDVRKDYSNPANKPVRIIAEGRDPSATIDSGLLGTTGFQNEGDNEITGMHISDGDPKVHGLLGTKDPHPFKDGWRVFYTAQHGDNVTWEIVREPGRDDDDDDHHHDH